MQMPVPAGVPLPLSAEVAGSLSRLQGELQAAQPGIQRAYAMHWLAMRQAGGMPAFQRMTEPMLWGLYGTTALSGLLQLAITGRTTTEVMQGILDQLQLIQHSYGRAALALQELLQTPEARQLPAVPPMVQSLGPLSRVYQAVEAPMQTVLSGLTWYASTPVPMVGIPRAIIPGGVTPRGRYGESERPQ